VRKILDFLYSDTIWMTVVLIVVMFLCVGFAFANPFRNKALNYIYKGFLYVFAFAFFMSFSFLYYGYANSFEKMCVGNTTISLLEKYERGGEGGSENVCRLHLIDKTTGVLKERYYVGHSGELVGMRNDTICYMNNDDLILFDAIALKEIYKIAENEWATVLPEFSVGMERISSNQNSDSPVRPFIHLECKNGKKYTFDPFSKKILDKDPGDIFLPEFTKETYELSCQTSPGKKTYYLKTQSINSGKLEMILPATESEKLFLRIDSTSYIDPFLLAIDTIRKCFVFGHYTTTDKDNFYLEARDFSFKPLWKKTPEDMGAVDKYNTLDVNVRQYKDEILYLNCGGFVLAMNALTGKIIWNTRL
jgi:hypothetical protein